MKQCGIAALLLTLENSRMNNIIFQYHAFTHMDFDQRRYIMTATSSDNTIFKRLQVEKADGNTCLRLIYRLYIVTMSQPRLSSAIFKYL